MKKILAALLAASLAVTLCACKAENNEDSNDESSAPQQSVQESRDASEKSEKEASEVSEEAEITSKAESSEESSKVSEQSGESSGTESSAAEESSKAAQASEPVQQQSHAPSTSGEVTGLSLSASDIVLYPGQTYKITAVVTPDNAADRSINIEWSDSSVITVSSDFVVTALNIGSAVITASSSNGKKAVCNVTVKEKPAAPADNSQHQVQPSDNSDSVQPAQPVEPDPGSGYVSADWFDDAVFVGDSVTLKLSYYAENGSLGNAAFLCAGSLGYNNALWDINRSGNVHPTLYGKKYTVDAGVKASGKKKVFIMLGMNDVGLYGVDGAASGMIELTNRILQKSPDVQIYIESVTPMLKNKQRAKLNNSTIPQFNARLREICSSRGFVFINVASAVMDSQGNLSPENCSDPSAMGIHFTNTGCSKWVEYLKTHVS